MNNWNADPQTNKPMPVFGPDTQPPAFAWTPAGQTPPPPQQFKQKKSRTGLWTFAVVAAFVLGLGIGAVAFATPATDAVSNEKPAAVGTTTPAKPSSKPSRTLPKPTPTKWGNGLYEVGSDIKPGKYKSTGGDLCYWARLSSLDGQFSSIIANSASTGPQVVVIKSTDKGFKTQSCGDWERVK